MHRAADQPKPNPLREGLSTRPVSQPCAIVIFGATGDLTHRKLIPALYNLAADGELPAGAAIVGFARRNKSDDEFRGILKRPPASFPGNRSVTKFGRRSLNRLFTTRASSTTSPVTNAWPNAWMKSIKITAPAAIAFSILRLLQISSNRSSST